MPEDLSIIPHTYLRTCMQQLANSLFFSTPGVLHGTASSGPTVARISQTDVCLAIGGMLFPSVQGDTKHFSAFVYRSVTSFLILKQCFPSW